VVIGNELRLDDASDTPKRVSRGGRHPVGYEAVLHLDCSSGKANRPLSGFLNTVAHYEVEASRDRNANAVCIRPVTDLAHSHSESRRSQGGVGGNVFTSDEVVACNNLRSGREALGKGADTYVLVSLAT